jgi:serine/threonine protein phosphatase PrpC
VVGAPDDPRPASVIVACDGVSTSRDPHLASLVAADLIRDHLVAALGRGEAAQAAMTSAIEAAQLAVAGLAEDPADPGNSSCATVVAAVLEPGLVTVGSVGDSRVYWLAPDPAESRRLTDDDSWAGLMIAQGILGEEEAYRAPQAHTIIRWLGADAPDEPPHIVQFAPQGPGLVLACSDGLWNYVPEASRLAELAVPTGAGAWGGLQAAANSLCAVALEGGGHDNITVTLAAYPPVSAAAGHTEEGRLEGTAVPAGLAETVQLPRSQAEHGQESTVEGSAL